MQSLIKTITIRKDKTQEINDFVSKPLFDEELLLNKNPSYPRVSIVTLLAYFLVLTHDTLIEILLRRKDEGLC